VYWWWVFGAGSECGCTLTTTCVRVVQCVSVCHWHVVSGAKSRQVKVWWYLVGKDEKGAAAVLCWKGQQQSGRTNIPLIKGAAAVQLNQLSYLIRGSSSPIRPELKPDVNFNYNNFCNVFYPHVTGGRSQVSDKLGSPLFSFAETHYLPFA